MKKSSDYSIPKKASKCLAHCHSQFLLKVSDVIHDNIFSHYFKNKLNNYQHNVVSLSLSLWLYSHLNLGRFFQFLDPIHNQ
jgi:hypothetical protein